MSAAWALILIVQLANSVSTSTTYFTTLDMCKAAKARMVALPTWPGVAQGECVLVGPGLKGDDGIPVVPPSKPGK